MANTVTIRTTVPGAKESAAEVKNLQNAFGLLGTGAGKTGVAIGVSSAITTKALGVMGTAISGVTDFIGGSIGAASSLNETINKSEVIFGDSADEIEAWGDTAADSFGQSKEQAIDTASAFGGLFKTVGLTADEASEKAIRMTELGSDLASFFDTDVQTAIDAIRSGLSGESEPLRKFNVFLSETAVNAKAAEMGLKPVGGVLTEQQKIMARYQIILDQTGDAQGDFARTSDSLANQQRELESKLADTQARLGQELLPVMQEVVGFANDEFIPALEGVVEVFSEVNKTLQDKEAMDFNDLFPDILPSEVDAWLDPITGAWADLFGNGPKSLQNKIDLSEAGTKIMQQVIKVSALAKKAGMEGFEEVGVESGNSMEEGFLRGMQTFKDKTEELTMDAMEGIADTVDGSKSLVKNTMDEFTNFVSNPLKRMKEIARTEGALANNALQNALESDDPGKRAAANDAVEILVDHWSKLTGIARREGESAVEMLERILGGFDTPPPVKWTPFKVVGIGTTKGKQNFRPGRARGGPVAEDEVVVVGEEGPELVMGGKGGAHVFSNPQSKAMMNGPSRIMVNVRLSTREFASQSRHNAIIQQGWGGFR